MIVSGLIPECISMLSYLLRLGFVIVFGKIFSLFGVFRQSYIYIYVYVCVCVYVYMSVCPCMLVYTCACASMCKCMGVCLCAQQPCVSTCDMEVFCVHYSLFPGLWGLQDCACDVPVTAVFAVILQEDMGFRRSCSSRAGTWGHSWASSLHLGLHLDSAGWHPAFPHSGD